MIDKFISQVKTRGIAKTNRYEVIIPFPRNSNFPIPPDMMELGNLFCDQVNLPGINVATTAMRTFGEVREMPYEKMFEPVTFSFYVDTDMQLKMAFDKWMALISNPIDRTIGYYNDYVKDIDIYVKTVGDQSPYMITLYEAYPKAVQSIQLDSGGKEIMKMTVTMQYKYWYSRELQSSTSAGKPLPSTPAIRDRQSVNTGTGYVFGENYSLFGNSFTNASNGRTSNSAAGGMGSFDPPKSTFSQISLVKSGGYGIR